MRAHLYFICPTDCLEAVINTSFKQRNYYYTSLGNSLTFNPRTIKHVRALIEKYDIQKISLVLSENNPIIRDALSSRNYLKTLDLNAMYDDIMVQKKSADTIWRKYNSNHIILSYYLNKKVNELRAHLNGFSRNQLEIQGKIYNQKQNVFNDIYSDLICKDYFSLN